MLTRRLTLPLAAASLFLAGCSPLPPASAPDENPLTSSTTLTLDEAKAITLERQDEIAAQFPAANTGPIVRLETSRSLYYCEEHDTFQWPGITRIAIVGNVDRSSVIDTISTRWDDRDGWTAAVGTSANGLPQVTLRHDDGSRFTVGFYEGGSEFWVDAASPCFLLEGGLRRGGEY
ncbi:hypothetical protein [Microcella sp.]|uniref:hypothetical protein n=1 Tax=Microcella sp. TaxID=1913979 RepID=UPI003F6F2A60